MQSVKGGGMFARLGSLLHCGAAASAGEISAHIKRGAMGRGGATPTPREAAEALRHMIARCDRHHPHDRGPWQPPHCPGQRPPRPHPPHCRPQPLPMPWPGWGCHPRPPKMDPPGLRLPFPDPCAGNPVRLIPLASGRG